MPDLAPPQLAPVDAVQERPVASTTDAMPEALALPPPLAPTGDSPFRTSSLRVKLALLYRGHVAAANARFRRRFLITLALLATFATAGILGGVSGAAMHALLYEDSSPRYVKVNDEMGRPHYFVDDQEVDYVQYQLAQKSYSGYSKGERRADAAGFATGILVFLLFPLLIWFLLIRRLRLIEVDGLNLDEQVAGIVRAHPAQVESWGGPVVLRNRDLVRELLAIEEDELRRADGRPAR